jgi:phosphatidylethanolamine/phosphatidyl-N-methylethanolamine N-methyltransferase
MPAKREGTMTTATGRPSKSKPAKGARRPGAHGAPTKAPPKPKSKGRLVFFREFLRSPGQLGSMFASGKALSRKMVDGIGIDRARVVVELGPGPGPVTEEIFERIQTASQFIAIEQNPGLAAALRKRFPRIKLHVRDAADIATICEDEGILRGTVDCVISGLPFLLFPEAVQRKILGEIRSVLRPGGYLAQVTLGAEVLPNTRKFRKLLEEYFPGVKWAGPVLANVPPAFVYRCRKSDAKPATRRA